MRENKGSSILNFPESYTVIDVETTGFDPAHDSLIEVAAIKIRDMQVIDSYSSLINPNLKINYFITELTGITNEQLSEAPQSKKVMQELFNFIGEDILVGHNVNFDINFLYDNFEKYLGKSLSNNFIDTLRLSKKYYKTAPSYKLSILAQSLDISVETSHRALADCKTTNLLYQKLLDASTSLIEPERKLLDSLHFDESNPFYKKRIAVKGDPQIYSYYFMKEIAIKCQAKISDIFYSSCDFIVFNKFLYRKYKAGDSSHILEKANSLESAGTLTILSEEEWCKLLNLPTPQHVSASATSAKDITTDKIDFDETHPLYNKLCVFTGALEKMTRRNAMQMVVDYGGHVANSVTKKTNYLILGNNDYCPLVKDGKSSKQKKAEELKLAGNDIEIISENVFYDMISEE